MNRSVRRLPDVAREVSSGPTSWAFTLVRFTQRYRNG